MKKVICALGMVSLLSLGLSENASAQYGYGGSREISARAKGAIIGAGLGAAAGAIIHRRDPVAGAVVGAVVGGGTGYVIGNNEDKIRRQSGYGYYEQPTYQYRQQQSYQYEHPRYRSHKQRQKRYYQERAYNNYYNGY